MAGIGLITPGGNGTSGSTGAGLPATIVSRTTAYTATAGDFVEADTSSAGFTVTLPSNPAAGSLVAVKKISNDTNTLTIAPSGSGTIDGDSNATTITQWAGAVFEHRGSDVWRIAATMTTTGPAGPSGTMAVGTVTTGAAGSSVAVTNVGTASAAVLNFAIPKGDTGAAGTIAAVQNQGSGLTARGTLNFSGAGITATDDAANSRTTVTVNALGSSVYGFPVTLSAFNYLGATAASSLNSRIYFCRAFGSGTITKIRILVGTSSGNICVGVYAGSGNSGIATATPGVRKATSGSVACPASGQQDVALLASVAVNEGDWFAIMADNSTATFHSAGSGSVSNQYIGQNGWQGGSGTVLPLADPAPAVQSWENKSYWMVGIA